MWPRFQQLRNLGFFDDTGNHILRYTSSHQRDIDILNREIVYFDKRWVKRQKHFYRDEREQIMELRNLMPEIIQTCNSIESFGKDHILQISYNETKRQLKDQLYDYRTKLDELIENVWEESHPDD